MKTTDLPMKDLLDKLWIDLEGQPYHDLRRGKTLRAVHHLVAFVLASPGTELAAAINEVREMQAEQDVPVLLILLGDEDMDLVDMACGWDGDEPWAHQVPVYDVDMVRVGAIRLNAVGGTDSPCEHGYLARHTTVARVIHKGDLFMVVNRNEEGLLLVYRALADYDRRKDRVRFERTTPGLGQPSKQYMELPPNLLVYVSWEEVEEARSMSAYDIEVAASEG